MAVVQNECYRLVTIGYLKKLIEQSGSGTSLKSLVQKSDGTYQSVSEVSGDTYCPTYGELTGGTFVQVYKAGTTPNGDTDGLVVNTKWKGDGTTNYANNQCVDRADVSVRYTRISGLQLSVAKHTFDGCGESGTSVSVSNTYIRKTKSMSGCAADEGSIVYSTAATEASAACDSTFIFHKSLANTVSTISCTKYDITKNTGDTERTDDVYVTVKFRGTEYPSNHEILTQPAGFGAYSEPTSSRNVPTEIKVTPSPSTYKVGATCNDKCEASVNSPISLAAVGVYDVWTTYAYKKCGVVDRSKTKEILTKTGQEMSIPGASLQWVTSGSCYGETAGQPIDVASTALTVTWSGLTVNRTFIATATTKHCESPKPVLECCQLNGPMTLTCSGTVQFEVGECGCDNMVDLGLSVKWGQYPMGTDENYNTFNYYIWGHTYEAHEGDSRAEQPQYEGDKSQCSSYRCETQLDDAHDAIITLYPDSGYRMPTKAEAEELVNNCDAEHVTDYKGKGVAGWLLTSKINSNELFLPEYGELYPPDGTHSTWWKRMDIPMTLWTRSGAWINEDNPVGHRLVYDGGNGPQGYPGPRMPLNGGSRKYGCLVMPVCDRG